MDIVCSLSEYFHQAVTDAMKARNVEANEMTEFYLVNLLAQYSARADFDDEPLALKMADALEADEVAERARKLRDVGDTSLYLSGFFAESLQRRTMDLDYFVEMGGAAYRRLSQIARFSREASFEGAWHELSDKFRAMVGVLNEISEAHAVSTPNGMLRLYERWSRTRDEDLERRLRGKGLLLGGIKGSA